MASPHTAAFSTHDDADNFSASAPTTLQPTPAAELTSRYAIPGCLSWLKELQPPPTRLALQFPDELLVDSMPVAVALEAAVPGLKTYILADTSYGSCCVDEVAAAHVEAEALVHFGDACLSQPPKAFPVHFVFPQLRTPVRLAPLPAPITAPVVVLLYPLELIEQAPRLCTQLGALKEMQGRTLVEARPLDPTDSTADGSGWTLLGRRMLGLDGKALAEPPTDFCTLFVGSPDSPLLTLWRLSHPESSQVLVLAPGSAEWTCDERAMGRLLRRRLFLIEKVKDASSVGIVGGALGVCGQAAAIRRAEELVAGAGKSVFTLSVGKLNPAKLANFASEIDVFALVACPFGLLTDTSEHYRPIVSLFELEVALNAAAAPWDPSKGIQVDFNKLQIGDVKLLSEVDDDGTPDVSLISGNVRVPAPRSSDSAQLLPYNPGDYFRGRTWKGLEESESAIPEAAPLEEGRKGVAMSYQSEPT